MPVSETLPPVTSCEASALAPFRHRCLFPIDSDKLSTRSVDHTGSGMSYRDSPQREHNHAGCCPLSASSLPHQQRRSATPHIHPHLLFLSPISSVALPLPLAFSSFLFSAPDSSVRCLFAPFSSAWSLPSKSEGLNLRPVPQPRHVLQLVAYL